MGHRSMGQMGHSLDGSHMGHGMVTHDPLLDYPGRAKVKHTRQYSCIALACGYLDLR